MNDFLKGIDKKNDLLILAVNPNEISEFIAIRQFMESGGRVLFPAWNSPDDNLLEVFGVIKSFQEDIHYGLKTCVPVFPGLKEASSKSVVFSSSFVKVKLNRDVQILLESEKRMPLAWKVAYGKGQCMVFNSNLLWDYKFCGLLLQFTSMLNDYFLYTVFNAKVVFIDDFPAPIQDGTEFSIASNYDGRSYEEFYREIWWPDLKRMGNKYGFKYTCLVLGNYENSVNMPPALVAPKTVENIKYFAKDIIKNGNELGLHGYNHASLLTAKYAKELKEIDYEPWHSIKDMEKSLSMLKKNLNEILGDFEPYTYVPPMNMLARVGKQAILNVFPSVKCFAGLGEPFFDEPGVLHQAPGQDPDFPGVYDLPRFTCETVYLKDKMFSVFSYLAAFGIFSHFIHPDDLLDPERSYNKPWAELCGDLNRIFAEVSNKCPFSRGMTAKEFTQEQLKILNLKVYSYQKADSIIIRYSKQPEESVFHYLRLNDGMNIESVENGRFHKIAEAGNLYLIEGTASPVKISLTSKQRNGK